MAPNTYIAVSDCIAGLGSQIYGLLDVASGATITANTTLLAAISEANDRIDGTLRAHYTLPLATVPPVLIRIGVDLVRWYLVGARPDAESQSDRDRYKDAEALLEAIGEGKFKLEVASAIDSPSGASTVAAGDSSSSGTMTDPTWLTDY